MAIDESSLGQVSREWLREHEHEVRDSVWSIEEAPIGWTFQLTNNRICVLGDESAGLDRTRAH